MRMKNRDVYNTIKFDTWASAQGLMAPEKYMLAKFVLPRDRSATILDVGTGNGRFLFEMSREGFTDLQGIDVSEKLIAVARQRAGKGNIPIKFDLMDASCLSFKDNSYDVVFALGQVISFIDNDEDRLRAIRECCRVLKTDGLLVCSFLHYGGRWYNPLISVLSLSSKLMKRDFDFLSRKCLPFGTKSHLQHPFTKQPYAYWFTREEILEMLNQAGFTVIEARSKRMILEDSSAFKAGGPIFVAAKKQKSEQEGIVSKTGLTHRGGLR